VENAVLKSAFFGVSSLSVTHVIRRPRLYMVQDVELCSLLRPNFAMQNTVVQHERAHVKRRPLPLSTQ